jgi:hypothetical protein
VSVRTVSRRLNCARLKAWRPIKIPLLTWRNRHARHQWSRDNRTVIGIWGNGVEFIGQTRVGSFYKILMAACGCGDPRIQHIGNNTS